MRTLKNSFCPQQTWIKKILTNFQHVQERPRLKNQQSRKSERMVCGVKRKSGKKRAYLGSFLIFKKRLIGMCITHCVSPVYEKLRQMKWGKEKYNFYSK